MSVSENREEDHCCGFVAFGACNLEIGIRNAVRQEIQSKVEREFASALAQADVHNQPEIRRQISDEIEKRIDDEVERQMPGPDAMF